VSGVGIRDGALTVYLAEDSEELRRDVAALLESEEPGAPPGLLLPALSERSRLSRAGKYSNQSRKATHSVFNDKFDLYVRVVTATVL